jgi:hypothetical protein
MYILGTPCRLQLSSTPASSAISFPERHKKSREKASQEEETQARIEKNEWPTTAEIRQFAPPTAKPK